VLQLCFLPDINCFSPTPPLTYSSYCLQKSNYFPPFILYIEGILTLLLFTAAHLTKGIREKVFVNYFIFIRTDVDWIYKMAKHWYCSTFRWYRSQYIILQTLD